LRSASLVGPTTRLRLICALLLTCFAVLAARAAHLTVVDMRGQTRGDLQIRSLLRLPAPRGLIVDRRGVELAVTVEAPSIYAIPGDLEHLEASAQALGAALGQDPAKLAETFRTRQRFTFLKRWASADEARKVEQLGLKGIGILREPRRAYPAGSLAGQLVGFVNIDGQGVRGIEQQEQRNLRGRARTVRVERDARGRLLVSDPALPRDFAGGDVRLTVDSALQAEAEVALRSAIEKTGARAGVVATLDPATGDVLSLAEFPSVDPNSFRQLDFASTRSRAFLDAFEPGSTLKAFLVAGALEAGVVNLRERIDTGPGWLRVPGKTIRDREAYGELSVSEVLQISSNVGAVLIAQRLQPRRHYEALRRFGFGRKTGSGFPQESAGLLRSYESWKPVDHATVAFGQGISVTPVQLAAATAALANGGILRTPRLVAARRAANGAWQPTAIDSGRRIVSETTAAHTLRMMESVVSSAGTGRRAALEGVRVAGKTGTAQKFDAQAGRYSRTAYLAWFIGAVPADRPKLAIVVVLDEPQGLANGGGDAAAPLFAEVASAQLAHLGIVTSPAKLRAERFPTLADREPKRTRPGPQQIRTAAATTRRSSAPDRVAMTRNNARARSSRQAQPIAAATVPAPARAASPQAKQTAATAHRALFVPDFRGETVASAMRMAAEGSLALELRGDRRGLAVEQDPDPGTVVVGDRPQVQLRFTLGMGEG
jgi:cell division protein FtsI (penicillin-binding protein 3)